MNKIARFGVELALLAAFLSWAATAQIISGGGGGSTTTTAAPLGNTVTNLTPTNLPHWRKAIANVNASTGRGRICFSGNSTMGGFGALAGDGFTNNYPGGLVPKFAKYLNAHMNTPFNSNPVSFNSIVNDQNITIAGPYVAYDQRVTFGANWDTNPGILGIAGNPFHYATGAVNDMTFKPNGLGAGTSGGVFDTIVVKYNRITGLGTATINVDGGSSLGTLNANVGGGFSIQTDTFTVPRGTHTIHLVGGNTGDMQIESIQAYDSAIQSIDVFQMSWGGGGVANLILTGNTKGTLAFADMACDLHVMSNTLIDSNNNTGLALYGTTLTTWATAMRAANADVIFMVDTPSNSVNATNGTLDAYIAQMQAVANSFNPPIPLINTKARWTSFAFTNPIFPYYDSLHPGGLGYEDQGLQVCDVLCP